MEGIPFHIESWMQTGPTLQHCQDQVMHTLMGMYSVKYSTIYIHIYIHISQMLIFTHATYIAMYVCTYVTGPVKIDHLSAKNYRFLVCLLYHNLVTIYTTATKSSSLLQNLMGFLLQLMEMG